MNTFLLGKEIKTLGSNIKQDLNKPTPLLDMMPGNINKQTTQTIPVQGNISLGATNSIPPLKTETVMPKLLVTPQSTMVKSTVPIIEPVKTTVIMPKVDVIVHEKIKNHINDLKEVNCPDIKKDLEEIKRKLNILSGHDNLSAHELSIPQGSDSALLLAKQAGLNPDALVARHQATKKVRNGHKREYFDPQQTCTQACTTIVDNITYTNLVLLIVLVIFIYLMRN